MTMLSRNKAFPPREQRHDGWHIVRLVNDQPTVDYFPDFNSANEVFGEIAKEKRRKRIAASQGRLK